MTAVAKASKAFAKSAGRPMPKPAAAHQWPESQTIRAGSQDLLRRTETKRNLEFPTSLLPTLPDTHSRMDLKDLQLFLAVAKVHSLSKASALLSMTQPGISRQIKRLEHDLGAKLLHRDGRGVSLTAAGRILAAHGEVILTEMQDIRSELEILQGEPRGVVTLGVTPTISILLLPQLFRALQSGYPRITLRVLESLSGEINEWLVNGRVDVGVLAQSPATRQRHGEQLVVEDLFLVGPGDMPRAGSDCPLPDLADYPLILPSAAHGLRVAVQSTADRLGVRLNVVLEMDALSGLINLAQEGMGYTILPDYVVERQARLGLVGVRRIVSPAIQRLLILATAAGKPLTPAAGTVSTLIRDQFAALTRDGVWIRQQREFVHPTR